MINAVVFKHSLQRLSIKDKRLKQMMKHVKKMYVCTQGLNSDLLTVARFQFLSPNKYPWSLTQGYP